MADTKETTQIIVLMTKDAVANMHGIPMEFKQGNVHQVPVEIAKKFISNGVAAISEIPWTGYYVCFSAKNMHAERPKWVRLEKPLTTRERFLT